MKIFRSPGGSEQWRFDRAGYVTASKFGEVRKRLKSGANKGDFTADAKKYAMRLAIERVSKIPLDEDGFNPWQAKRGQVLESQARTKHEKARGIFVEQVGFVGSDCGCYGASVDGFINTDGIAEYKAYLDPAKIQRILFDNDTSDLIEQVQGGLWITERDYCEAALYCPALACVNLDLHVIRIERNDSFINAMKAELAEFNQYVETLRQKLLNSDKIGGNVELLRVSA